MLSEVLQVQKRGQLEENIRQCVDNIDFQVKEYNLKFFIDVIKKEQIWKDLHWNSLQQSRFIEALLLGLPLLELVVWGDEEELHILKGKQSLYAALNFYHNGIELWGLQKLKELDGEKYTFLIPSRQKKFLQSTVRCVEIQSEQLLTFWSNFSING